MENNDQVKGSKTLAEWEGYLAPQVKQVELLGEINLSLDEAESLGRQLGQFIGHQQKYGSIQSTLNSLRRRYPCAFAVYLVAQGAHDEDATNGYWPDVDQALGLNLDSNWRSRLGQLFEEILEINNCPLFPEVTRDGHRYLSLILLHGGLPNYTLGQYFTYLLKPILTDPLLSDLPDEELIDEMRDKMVHESRQWYQPIRRFLENGGLIAQDIVKRTRSMAQEFLEFEQVPNATEVGLPLRFVEAFQNWIDVEGSTLTENKRNQPNSSRMYLRRPIIWIDPYGEGVQLDLPPQQLPAMFGLSRVQWEIQSDEVASHTINAHLQRAGEGWRTYAESILLEHPATTYTVTLLIDDNKQRTWTFNGATIERPLWLFDYERYTLRRWNNVLPKTTVMLFYPADYQLAFEGQPHKLEEFNRLPWGWSGLRGEAWDISDVEELTLLKEDEPIFTVATQLDETLQRPQLRGGNLLVPSTTASYTPLYTGQPPTLRIPLVGRTTVTDELSRWRLVVRSEGLSEPMVNIRKSLSELRSCLTIEDQIVAVQLNQPDLLGNRPFGIYNIRLRGPLGRDAEMRLRIVPHLAFTGHEHVHLPDSKYGPQSISLLIKIERGIELKRDREAAPQEIRLIEDTSTTSNYELIIAPEMSETRVTLSKLLANGQSIRLPIYLPLRRLRWALATDDEQSQTSSLQRTGQVMKHPVDALEQSESPLLFIDSGEEIAHNQKQNQVEPPSLPLYLVDQQDELLQIEVAKSKLTRGRGRMVSRFELIRFMDTIRHNPSPFLRFDLGYPTDKGEQRIPILILNRTLVVEVVQLDASRPQDGQFTLHLSWQDQTLLRHRWVRFWSLWKPWLPPHEIKLPDESDGEYTFLASAKEMPLGRYLVEFFVVDPWATPPEPKRPSAEATNTANVETISPEVRLNQIGRVLSQQGVRFDLFLERAHIRYDLRDHKGFSADVNRAYDNLDQATVDQILDLAKVVTDFGLPSLRTALRLKLFAPPRLKALFEAKDKECVTLTQFEDYMAYLPDKLPSRESCRLLLNQFDIRFKLYAIEQLLSSSDPDEGAEALLRLVEQKILPIPEAIALVQKQGKEREVEQVWVEEPENETALLLLEELNPGKSRMVRVGTWVATMAGRARIERITLLNDSDTALDYILPTQTGVRLSAILRPNQEATSIDIEILDDRHYVQFPNKYKKLYRCKQDGIKCPFITPSRGYMDKHNRDKHGGIKKNFDNPEGKIRFMFIEPLKFSKY